MPGTHKPVTDLNRSAATAGHGALCFVLPITHFAIKRARVKVAWIITDEVAWARRAIILHWHVHCPLLFLFPTPARQRASTSGFPLGNLAIHWARIAFTVFDFLLVAIAWHATVRRLNFWYSRTGALPRSAIRVARCPLLPTIPFAIASTWYEFAIRFLEVLAETLSSSVFLLHLDLTFTRALAVAT